jgi:imidazoleglycerol phosphate dehydratase HisB
MIDDGSVEARIASVADKAQAGVSIKGTTQVDIDWFLGLRCEQIKSGKPLVELLEGIAGGLPVRLDVTVCNMEDPHHSWEGVFRSVGIGLSLMLQVGQPASVPQGRRDAQLAEQKHWEIDCQSGQRAQVVRRTAESEVRVLMDFSEYAKPKCQFTVSNSIRVDGLSDLLELLCQKTRVRLEIDFRATRLSSSHVVMEDVGMVMGRTLQEIMVKRMAESGINGAGSSLTSVDDFGAPIHVGLSVEGRKFWTFVPMTISFDDLRRDFLVGHDVGRGLFTEDLDDFIDGFSGGLGGSVVIHVRGPVSPREGWPLIFQALGSAIAEALKPNPSRKGVPPGVKATLA